MSTQKIPLDKSHRCGSFVEYLVILVCPQVLDMRMWCWDCSVAGVSWTSWVMSAGSWASEFYLAGTCCHWVGCFLCPCEDILWELNWILVPPGERAHSPESTLLLSTVGQWEKMAGNGPCRTRTPTWSIGETQATGVWEILKRTFAHISVGALSTFSTSVRSFSECIR